MCVSQLTNNGKIVNPEQLFMMKVNVLHMKKKSR